jgi:fluoride exporter
MGQIVAIAVGGAVGSVLRFLMSGWVHGWTGRGFPYGTLTVNVLGSLLIGLLFVVLLERTVGDSLWRAGLLIGLIGGFTTFSTFSIETVNLIEAGELGKALANTLASVLLCVLAAWIGMRLGRQL